MSLPHIRRCQRRSIRLNATKSCRVQALQARVYMADVSGTVRDAHKSTGTGGNALWGNNEAMIISCPKIPSENIAFNPFDFPRMKPER